MRALSLRAFLAFSAAVTLLRLVCALAFLIAGPGFSGPYAMAEAAFVLAKAILGGLFWFISFPLEGWRDPLGWLFYPWR
ncbi:MAG: hypothetical protein RMK64_09655 [Rhodovarius sp.]|nr:hypothetical protein [Rhodovarius sp.]MCX7933602.1 hypothetical protein [Rhodovarius sp.]MDW8315222.1 hypothetical protein [Rhodovarius sp.]